MACFIVFAAVVRILPHPWNFTPLGAMALFSGAKLGRSWAAFLFPLDGSLCGDLFVGFYKLMLIVYLSFCLSVLIGIAFRHRQSFKPLSLATLLGAGQFFLITNFAVWALLGYTPPLLRGPYSRAIRREFRSSATPCSATPSMLSFSSVASR